jgi:pheromone shutdown protein TraB
VVTLTLIGTGHVFDIGERVREEIRLRQPVVVGIELDPPRYRALRSKTRDHSKAPFFYRLLANFQTRIADAYGVEAGAEMLAAADEAHALGVPLALIDADAQKTFQKLIRELTFGERLRLAGSIVAGVFLPAKSVEKQVDEMQRDYTNYFAELGKRFPTVKRVLLDDRNVHMARALRDLHERGGPVVAVMGDGHVDGVRDILVAQGLEVETVRLKDLRAARPEPTGNASATLSYQVPGEAPPPRE